MQHKDNSSGKESKSSIEYGWSDEEMKKSEYTVTMPINDYEQFVNYKNKYEQLVKSLRNCYDTNTHDNYSSEPVRFDSVKANDICKEFLGLKYANVPITM